MNLWVKYCGGCNPQIDREGLVAFLEKELGEKIFPLQQESDEQPRKDKIILFINGCPVGCVKNMQNIHSAIVVAGNYVDSFLVPAEKLFKTVLERVRKIGELAGGI